MTGGTHTGLSGGIQWSTASPAPERPESGGSHRAASLGPAGEPGSPRPASRGTPPVIAGAAALGPPPPGGLPPHRSGKRHLPGVTATASPGRHLHLTETRSPGGLCLLTGPAVSPPRGPGPPHRSDGRLADLAGREHPASARAVRPLRSQRGQWTPAPASGRS